MKNTDICPDGFPFGKTDDEWSAKENACDNCGKVFDPEDDETFLAKATGDNGEFHKYAFCSYDCACEFREKHGLVMNRLNECCFDLSFEHDPTAQKSDTNADPVAAAVKSINVGGVSTDVNNELDPNDKPVPEELVQEVLAADAPDPETPKLHEKKVMQVWDNVVRQAQEIAQLASDIEEKNNELKALKKEYETLVKRQNNYILSNGDGIQTTFADLDNAADPTPETDAKPDAEAETPDSDAEAVDSLAWRDEPVTTLKGYGLTEKQADKAQEAFGTLGRLQDWLCADYRDKQPGIGQALQDKLTDALNKYTETIYVDAKADADAETDAEAETDE